MNKSYLASEKKCGSYDCPEGLDPFSVDAYAGMMGEESRETHDNHLARTVINTQILCARCMAKGAHLKES